jgi:hypothetical protein
LWHPASSGAAASKKAEVNIRDMISQRHVEGGNPMFATAREVLAAREKTAKAVCGVFYRIGR